MTTPLFLLRAVELGLSVSDLSLLTIGLVNDMFTEKNNDEYKYKEVSTQEDFDKFYTQEEFTNLLDSAILVSENNTNGISTRSASGTAALVAGTWEIPGVGLVVVTVAGVILIKDVVIPAGSWTYKKVINWFENRAYNKAKENGSKTNDHSTQTGGSLPTKGRPNSSKDKKNPKTGKVVQRRYYDKDGNADMDIDYTNHGNPKQHPKVPHRHDWKNGKRGPAY